MAAVLFSPAAKADAPATMSFESFDSYETDEDLAKQWRQPHGEPSVVRLEKAFLKAGGKALRWNYRLGKYGTRASFIDRDPRPYDAIRFWILPDGSGRTFNIGIKNHAQKAFETKDLLKLNAKSPVQVTVPFSRLGVGAKDELLEELWILVSGPAGEGSIAIDGFEFVKEKAKIELEGFDRYKTPLDVFQHWKPVGKDVHLGDVNTQSSATDRRESGASLVLNYESPRVVGVSSFIEADARGFEGLRLWMKNVGTAKTFTVEAKNHAQQWWETPPLPLPDGDVIKVPFFAFSPKQGATPSSPRQGVPLLLDECLDQISIRVADPQGKGLLFIDNVGLYRHISAKRLEATTALRLVFQNVSAHSEKQIVAAVLAIAEDRKDLREPAVAAFARTISKLLRGKRVDEPGLVLWLAGDVDQVINPKDLDQGQIKGAVNDFGSALRKVGVPEAQLEVGRRALLTLAPPGLQARKAADGQHSYRLKVAPAFDDSVPIEDFENVSNIFSRWYQPVWSVGVTPSVQTERKSAGAQGLTIRRKGTLDSYNGFATVLKPARDISGMNALRMWVWPNPLANPGEEGRVSVGFIDGSDEIWQMEIPDFLAGTEPYFLQVPLQDFSKTLRRNNGVIDPEIHNVGLWMSGTYEFSIDDIRFVHDAKLPEFHPGN
ncbi:MAG: hypothetical protein SF187_14460 [Deltaproteobacteria bacterium]|nr:hypothetical protein [Deltaproteobacteria bacterium]